MAPRDDWDPTIESWDSVGDRDAYLYYTTNGMKLLVDFFGVRRVEETTQAILNCSEAQIDSARDVLKEYSDRRIFEGPQIRPWTSKAEGELRPLLSRDVFALPDAPLDLEGSHGFADSSLRKIQHYLLYAHCAAVEDPYEGVVCWEDRDTLRLVLTTYSVLMTYLYPLIESRVLFFVTPEEDWDECRFYSRIMGDVDDEHIPAAQRQELLDVIGKEGDAVEAFNHLCHELWRIKRLRSRVDLQLRAPAEQHLLGWLYKPEQSALARHGQIVAATALRDDEFRICQTICATPIPSLDALEATDLVRLRESTLFENWRFALKAGVATASAIPSVLDPTSGVLRDIQASLRHEARLVQNEFRSSKFLTEKRHGIRDFTVGAVTGGIVGPIVSAVFVSGSRAAAKAASARPRASARKGEDAFLRHVEIYNSRLQE